jgi:hypothetical protein
MSNKKCYRKIKKNKMRKISLLLLIAIVMINCNKLNIEKGTPKCVQYKIKDFNQSINCNDAKVDQYTFQGNTVYTFDPGNCGADLAAEVISSECNSLGSLGGFSGNTKINGVEFSTATFIKTIWKK